MNDLAQRLAFTLLIVGVVLIGNDLCAGMPLPDDIREGLQKQGAALRRIDITWEQTQSSPLSSAEFVRRLKLPNDKMYFPLLVHYVRQDENFYAFLGRYRVDFSGNRQHIGNAEMAFNGDVFYSGTGKIETLRQDVAPEPGLCIERIGKTLLDRSDHMIFRPEYFVAAGFKMPERFNEIEERPISMLLHQLEHGAEIIAVEPLHVERAELVMVNLQTSQSCYRYVLDRKLGYAVRHWEENSLSGELARKTVNREFAELTDPDIWLPQYCHVELHTWHTIPGDYSEEPLIVFDYNVSQLQNNPIPSETFVLNYDEPGSVIADATLPGAEDTEEGSITYIVPADPADLDAAIKYAIDGTPFVPSTLNRSRSVFRRLLLVLNCAVIVVLALVWWRRFLRGRK